MPATERPAQPAAAPLQSLTGEDLTPLQRARQGAMATCADATADELATAVAATGYAGAVTVLRRPEAGLVMVRGRTGGDGDAFNLGEMTVTRCVVRLDNGCDGYAFIPGRDGECARDAAVIDALMQTPNLADAVTSALEPVRLRQASDLAAAERRTAATRVNFFTLTRGED